MEESIKIKVLNDGCSGNNTTVHNTNEEKGNELIKQLKISMTNLKGNFMDENTGRVNYEEMMESTEFAAYRRYIKGLYIYIYIYIY